MGLISKTPKSRRFRFVIFLQVPSCENKLIFNRICVSSIFFKVPYERRKQSLPHGAVFPELKVPSALKFKNVP